MLTLLCLQGAMAQEKFLTAGFKIGPNLSQIRSDGKQDGFFDNEDTRSLGVTGGFFARIGKQFYLQPELMVSSKGGKLVVFESELFNTRKTIDYRSTYLDVPVLLGARIGKTVRINAGPMATFLINEDKDFRENFNEENEPAFSKAIVGYQAGLGVDIGKVNLDLRYEGNLNDVFNIHYDNAQTEARFAAKGNLFLFTVGFRF